MIKINSKYFKKKISIIGNNHHQNIKISLYSKNVNNLNKSAYHLSQLPSTTPSIINKKLAKL
jgi:hypothetical protein